MRKILIENSKILKSLEEKTKHSKRMLELADQMDKIEKEYNIEMAKTARIDEKIRPLVVKFTEKIELGEYEEISSVKEEEDKWYIHIADRMEEFKTNFASKDKK